MFGFLFLALATSMSPMVADVDGTWVFQVHNVTPSIIAVHTADYCTSETSGEEDNHFNVVPGEFMKLDCGADTAADPQAVVITKPPHVMCRIHLRDDNSPSVDNVTGDDCSASLKGTPGLPLIKIVVR